MSKPSLIEAAEQEDLKYQMEKAMEEEMAKKANVSKSRNLDSGDSQEESESEGERERNEEQKNKATITNNDYYKQQHHALFYKYDVNKTGYVTKAQFIQMIKEEDSSCTQAEIDQLVKQADPSDSGRISFEGLLKNVVFQMKAKFYKRPNT